MSESEVSICQSVGSVLEHELGKRNIIKWFN